MDISSSELASHRHFLLGVARTLLRNPSLAEDAVHDVFEAVLSGHASFEGRSALRSWLVAVLRHKATDLLRTMRHHQMLDQDGATGEQGFQPACPRPQPDQAFELRQAIDLAATSIDSLPVAMRHALQLRVIEDLAVPIVCERLSITPGNLGVRLHRARTILRESSSLSGTPAPRNATADPARARRSKI